MPQTRAATRTLRSHVATATPPDYIWLAGDVDLAPGGESSCQLFADKQCGDDPTLFCSDHYGLYADLRVGTGATTDAAYAAAFQK